MVKSERELRGMVEPLGWRLDGSTGRTGRRLVHTATGAVCSAPRSPNGDNWKRDLLPRLRRAEAMASAGHRRGVREREARA